MKALYWFAAIAVVTACILLFEAMSTTKDAVVDFQAYSTQTVDLLKGLEVPAK